MAFSESKALKTCDPCKVLPSVCFVICLLKVLLVFVLREQFQCVLLEKQLISSSWILNQQTNHFKENWPWKNGVKHFRGAALTWTMQQFMQNLFTNEDSISGCWAFRIATLVHFKLGMIAWLCGVHLLRARLAFLSHLPVPNPVLRLQQNRLRSKDC